MAGPRPDALSSLYGKGHAQATLNTTRTRECVAMPGVRNQVILTARTIIDGLRIFWPKGIAYDPAGAPGSFVGAARSTETRGLIDMWPPRTYCNPAYGTSLFDPENQMEAYLEECQLRDDYRDINSSRKEKELKPLPIPWPKGLPIKPKAGLKDWLEMQLTKSEGESIMLVPNRTNRKWFRAWRRKVTALVELDPLTFHGFPQSFPAPLVLGFMLRLPKEQWVASPVHTRVLDFFKAFKHVGDPVR